ncbi:RING finger protein 112, partial [Terrapene carolina triunguis]|uniref:RING finger protein 112 n=1 Tax=Terrapene triunguis TaxID=2587831 RepID=UPI000E77E2CE
HISRDLKTKRYDFSSPVKMAESFAAMRQELNSRAVEAARRGFEQFVQIVDRDHQSMSSCLKVKPEKMQQRLERKHQELLERCQGELLGEDPQKQAALEELKQELDRQMDQFLSDYKQRYEVKKAVRLGLVVGGSTLAVVGAGVGAGIGVGVAAAVVAVEEGLAIGLGAVSCTMLGGGVGSKLGAWLGEKFAWKNTDSNTPGQEGKGEGGGGCSDQEPLLQGGT